MKANKYMATLVASLAVVSTASAIGSAVRDFGEPEVPLTSRLAGWQSFGATFNANPTTNRTEVQPGFVATANLGAAPSGAGFGNSENVYGGSDWSAPSGGFNGSASVVAGTGTWFSVTNNTQIETQIGWLFFDVQRNGGADSPGATNPLTLTPGTLKISYDSPQGSGTLLPSVTGFSTTNDYTDFNYNLTSLGFILGTGESIKFTFELIGGAAPWLDNVGIAHGTSVIPEPGSMLALGCFLGSGLLIRRNRRSVA